MALLKFHKKWKSIIFPTLVSGIGSGRQKRAGLAFAPARKEQQGWSKTGTLKSVACRSLVLLCMLPKTFLSLKACCYSRKTGSRQCRQSCCFPQTEWPATILPSADSPWPADGWTQKNSPWASSIQALDC
jgi:hypothetical protein